VIEERVSDVDLEASRPSALSFDALFEEYASFVWRVLGRLGVRRSDVADASQEVFLVVHRRLASFEGRSSVKSWIYGICVKVAAGHRRQVRGAHDELDEDSRRVDGTSQEQEQELDQSRAREQLRQVLSQLDSDKREVFVLYELEELSMPEVAEALGCPVTTAYSRLHAARKLVRAAFARRTLTTSRAG
jgi:RNA polymerase sigma-70 factor (ECF subfamily)